MSAKLRSFLTSFADGLTSEGIFGDLSIPGFPTQVFKSDSPAFGSAVSVGQEWSEEVYVVHLEGLAMQPVDIIRVREGIERAVYAAREGRQVEIVMPEGDHMLVRRAAD